MKPPRYRLLIALAAFLPHLNASAADYETHVIAGWTVNVNTTLKTQDASALKTALPLLTAQLDEIIRVVPKAAVVELQKVPLWFSPPYPNKPQGAAYHPNIDWLRANDRNPAMAKGIEFTNVRIFEAETRRMPTFALHELAHAYHDRVLRLGFANLEIKAAYERAKASGTYDHVERKDAQGQSHFAKAYAMTNPQEYFAETTEAFFSRNDFYPFHLAELKQHDPVVVTVLERLWGVTPKP